MFNVGARQNISMDSLTVVFPRKYRGGDIKGVARTLKVDTVTSTGAPNEDIVQNQLT